MKKSAGNQLRTNMSERRIRQRPRMGHSGRGGPLHRRGVPGVRDAASTGNQWLHPASGSQTGTGGGCPAKPSGSLTFQYVAGPDWSQKAFSVHSTPWTRWNHGGAAFRVKRHSSRTRAIWEVEGPPHTTKRPTSPPNPDCHYVII